MKCPSCGQEYTDPMTICPGCGAPLPEPEVQEAPAISPEDRTEEVSAVSPEDQAEEVPAVSPEDQAEEAPVESPEPGEGPEDGTPEETADTDEPETLPPETAPVEAPKRKRNTLTIVLAAVAGVLLIAVVCLVIAMSTMSRGNDVETLDAASAQEQTASAPEPVQTLPETDWSQFDAEAVALELRDETGDDVCDVTNGQLGYYYWGEIYYHVQSYGLSFDPGVPLDQQMYSEELSWQDYFLSGAETSIRQVEALKAAAAAENFTLPESYQSEYDATVASLADYAAQAGFTDDSGSGDVLAYVRDSYGGKATVEDFEAYLYDSYFVTAYSDSLYDSVGEITDQELEDYYAENEETMNLYGIVKSDLPNVNVRHILIQPEETGEDATEAEQEAAREAAKAEAERIYQEWQDGEATEESFAALAGEYSTDPGSSSGGGLYEDVYPGQMVTAFNDWCFDESRQPGDTAIVETDYGFHIMYFVGTTDNYYWKQSVESELRYNAYQEKMNGLVDQLTVTETAALQVATPDAVRAMAGAVG